MFMEDVYIVRTNVHYLIKSSHLVHLFDLDHLQERKAESINVNVGYVS